MSTIISNPNLHEIPSNRKFNEIYRRLQAGGKIKEGDFATGAEVGAFMDFYNEMIKSDNDKRAQNDILEISKFVARTQGRRMFFGGGEMSNNE